MEAPAVRQGRSAGRGRVPRVLVLVMAAAMVPCGLALTLMALWTLAPTHAAWTGPLVAVTLPQVMVGLVARPAPGRCGLRWTVNLPMLAALVGGAITWIWDLPWPGFVLIALAFHVALGMSIFVSRRFGTPRSVRAGALALILLNTATALVVVTVAPDCLRRGGTPFL